MSTATLKEFASKLGTLSVTLAQRVATASADAITELGRATFEAGEDSYGTPWAPGADGKPVTLVKTGALRDRLTYKAVGRKLFSSLGVRYAKYQIGKRPVYPRGPLPAAYVEELAKTTAAETKKALGVSS